MISKLHQPKGATELLGSEENGTDWLAKESIVPDPDVIVIRPVEPVACEELAVEVAVEPPACPGTGPGAGTLVLMVLLAVWLRLTEIVELAVEEMLLDVEEPGGDVEVELGLEVEVEAETEALLVVGGGAELVDSPVERLVEAEKEVEVRVRVGCAPGGGEAVDVLGLWPCVCVTSGVPLVLVIGEAGPTAGAGW